MDLTRLSLRARRGEKKRRGKAQQERQSKKTVRQMRPITSKQGRNLFQLRRGNNDAQKLFKRISSRKKKKQKKVAMTGKGEDYPERP